MREVEIRLATVDGAVEKILGLFVQNLRDTRVIYFDGWRGFGASTVLRGVADALTSGRTPPKQHLYKVIHIDCSAWKSRRAMQRAVAVELQLGHSVMAYFDKQDEEDDFNGVDEGSRGEITSVTDVIDRALRDHRIMMVFHNGSGDDIDLSSFGFPPLAWFRDCFVLWTFRRRFRARELYSEIQNKVKNAHIFAYEPDYYITYDELFFPVLHREATAIAANYPCMREINTEWIVLCCLYELFLQLSFPKSSDYDWAARASNYWTCDGIIQGDRAWEISRALREEIKWDLHPTLLDQVRQRFTNEVSSENNSSHFLTFKDQDVEGQQQYPWISITSRNLQTQDMQAAIDAEASSYFLGPESSDIPLLLADGLFEQSTNLCVLHLSCCIFSFTSPPFISCQNLRFLGLDYSKDNIAGEAEDRTEWEFLHSLWVLDLFYTDWHQVFSKQMTDLMINLRELNVEGARCPYTSLVQGRLQNLHKLRITKPLCLLETSTCIESTFVGKTKPELLDFSGNKDMKTLPSSLSTAISLEVLILDGCNELENVAAPPSLKSLSMDGYGPASHWTPAVDLPPKESRPSSADQKHVKTSKISLEGCTRLENLFLRGLPNLIELDLSGTAIKILDFNTMVVDVPRLKRVFLLGCERLRAIRWDMRDLLAGIQPGLELLCIDSRPGIECPQPSVDLNKSFLLQVHAIIADARLARSLWFLIDYYREWRNIKDVYFNIRITSSPVQLEAASSDQVNLQQLVPANQYSDVISMDGDAPMRAFPQPPSTELDRHIEIAQGSLNVESELDAYSPHANLGRLIKRCAESLHVHDVLTSASMPGGDWEHYLRRCHVERCPKLAAVFPSESFNFVPLETFWASDLLMAHCIWSKGFRGTRSFKNLQHLHLCSCPSLQFVLPMWVSSFPSLETLHIIHCGDLRHVFVLHEECPEEEYPDEEYPQEEYPDEEFPDEEYPQEIAFPKLTTIHLHDLPMLQQICEVKMVAPALETIRIRGCWGLRRLPAIEGRGEDEKKPAVEIEKDVWDALEWDGVEAGHDHSLFEKRHSRYYKKKLPRVSVLR